MSFLSPPIPSSATRLYHLARSFACLSFSLGAALGGLSAAILEVAPLSGADDGASPFATLQAAVAAAQPGDTIRVHAGTLGGEVIVAKPLILEGANAGRPVDESRESETVLTGTLRIAHNGVRVDGFAFHGPTAGIAADPAAGASNIVIEHNLFTAMEGPAAIFLAPPAAGAPTPAQWTVRQNTFEDFAGEDTVAASFSSVSGLHLENNRVRHLPGSLSPAGGFVLDSTSDTIVRGNHFALNHNGFALRVGMESGPVENLLIENNEIADVHAGVIFHDGALHAATLRGNSIRGAWVGVDARAPSPEAQVSGPQRMAVYGNDFSTAPGGWALRLRPGAYAAADDLRVEENALVGGNLENAVAGRAVAATRNWWGTGDWALIPGRITGAGAEAVAHNPWYADADRTHLVQAFTGADGIAGGEHVSADSVVVLPGSTLSVEGVLQVNGDLTLTEGAVLDVVNGSLILEDGSALSGSFSFFNSFGSVFFNDDVSLTTSASGLILVSDVHVAPGATIFIDGKLTIDGSVVESSGSYFFLVSSTGSLTMARSVMINGSIFSTSPNIHLYDNRIVNGAVILDAAAVGARIYHNIVGDPNSWIFGSSAASAITTVDGWGNVSDPEDTENNLFLRLDIAGLPNRTIDLEGNIYIQPGDPFAAVVELSKLQTKIAGVEMLLGYSTSFLTAQSLTYAPDWDRPIVVAVDGSSTIGKIDAAVGVSFNLADPLGTDADGPLGEVLLEANPSVEGTTVFFQRVKLPTDTFGGETRFTTGGTSPAYLKPFTANSPSIFIDGTPPVIADIVDFSAVFQDGEDMTLAGNVTLRGDLLITAAAYDAFVGIEDAAAVVTLVGPATYTATRTGTSLIDIGGVDYTVYDFVFSVDGTVENGTYDAVFTVMDRSGNVSSEILGTIEINKSQVFSTVQLQGLVSGPVTRDVVFAFTDINGNLLESRTETLDFLGGTASVLLEAVPPAAVRISAKTAWNLRRRLDLAFTDGEAPAAFTGADQLRGGDLSGNNIVGTIDFAILRNFFNQVGGPALQADITGSGFVGTIDFAILRENFNQIGDPL